MKQLLSIFSALILISCSGTKVQTNLNLKLEDYFFDRTVGGTPEAGISKTFWLKPEDSNLIIETIVLDQESQKAEAQEEGYYTATFFFKTPTDLALASSNTLEYFARLKKGDMLVRGVIDSVALRNEIFMPAAPRQP